MVGEDVVQQEAHPARGAEAFVNEADASTARFSPRALVLLTRCAPTRMARRAPTSDPRR